jgi:ribosome-binding factor A
MTRERAEQARHLGPSQRQLRVGEEIRHVLAELLGGATLRDPALAGVSITVSEVRVSPDLQQATAFVMPLGGGDIRAIVKALGRAGPFLRGEVARRVRLRLAPTLSFVADTSFDHAAQVERALRAPDVVRDLSDEPER